MAGVVSTLDLTRDILKPYLLGILEFICYCNDILDILRKAQIGQCLLNVFNSNSFLSLLLGYVVCFGGNQGDELDATFDE